LLALCALVIAPEFYLGLYDRLTGGWVQEWTPRMVFTVATLVAALKFAGVLLIQLWPPLKFFLIPPPIKTTRVHDRAIRAFRIGAERRTHGRTGILIYLSMREHRAEIVADEAIAGMVDPGVWGDAMAAMLAELKQGRTADGMIAAVERVGAVLAEHFPRADDDVNELPDRLIEV
jgi:putative membrane protein